MCEIRWYRYDLHDNETCMKFVDVDMNVICWYGLDLNIRHMKYLLILVWHNYDSDSKTYMKFVDIGCT